MNLLQLFEKKNMEKSEGKIPDFKAGDVLKVHTKIIEGKKSRIQIYEGLCIARKNNGMGSSFNVRKISFGVGVERIFPLYSPNIEKIEKLRIGKIRRAKLYYMRKLTGRKARIVEDIAKAKKEREADKK
ncbi:MAG: 50S ribosomal protein L19 [Alphaproteobacteria bacterium]